MNYGEEFLETTFETVFRARADGRGDGYGVSANHCAAGEAHVFWTEFVSCDGLCSRGRETLLRDFLFTKIERPIVAQVFGATPKNFYEAARLVVSLGFDGIDINMGCPDRAVLGQGAGAALIRTPELAREIIVATKEGIASTGSTIPLSVKTRTGFDSDEIDTWIPMLLDAKFDALTIHCADEERNV